jgi:hypothetical protein
MSKKLLDMGAQVYVEAGKAKETPNSAKAGCVDSGALAHLDKEVGWQRLLRSHLWIT